MSEAESHFTRLRDLPIRERAMWDWARTASLSFMGGFFGLMTQVNEKSLSPSESVANLVEHLGEAVKFITTVGISQPESIRSVVSVFEQFPYSLCLIAAGVGGLYIGAVGVYINLSEVIRMENKEKEYKSKF